MTAAVDSSVALTVVFAEEQSERGSAFFRDAAWSGTLLTAPFLMPAEVTNAVRRRMRAERWSLDVARDLLTRLDALSIDLLEPAGLHHRALELAAAHSLSAYDAHYVALAEFAGCELWTTDLGMLTAVRGRLPFVKWIGDYR